MQMKPSPDPPREESEELGAYDPDAAGAPFIAVWEEDEDFWGEGPYELDIGGESESDEVSGDEAPLPPDPEAVVGTRRGHYQLLIPFPNPAPVATPELDLDLDSGQLQQVQETLETQSVEISNSPELNNDSNNDGNRQQSSQHNENSSSIASAEESNRNDGRNNAENDNVKENDPTPNSTGGASASAPHEKETRDIPLNEETVEKIKEAMSNFKLPSSSIPQWATDISEVSWKNSVMQTLQGKSSSQKHSHNNNSE